MALKSGLVAKSSATQEQIMSKLNSKIKSGFQSSRSSVSGSQGPRFFSSENGLLVVYEILTEIPMSKESENVLIDTIFIMVCLPDSDTHKMVCFVFEPICSELKQLI